MGILNNLDEFAKLLETVGSHKKERPLTPIQTAKDLRILLDECEGSIDEVAERLPVVASTIRLFLNLLKLPKTVHGIIGWGETDTIRLTFISASFITRLKNASDQEVLAKVAQAHSFKKREILDVIALKKRNPDKPIEDCIESVVHFRPRIEKGYLVITNIKQNTLSLLKKLNKNGRKIEDLICDAMESILPKKSLNNVLIKEDFVFLNLTEDGYKEFESFAQKLNTNTHYITDTWLNKFFGEKLDE